MGAPQTIVPDAVYHADWGTSPDKRFAEAVLENGRYTAEAPVQVGDHHTLMSRAKADSKNGQSVILGQTPCPKSSRYR